MKLTRLKLKEIIREELRLLSEKEAKMFMFNGFINDDDGEGAGGYRYHWLDVVAPNMGVARKLVKAYADKYGRDRGALERGKKPEKKGRDEGVYYNDKKWKVGTNKYTDGSKV
jgi:hypothetical protein